MAFVPTDMQCVGQATRRLFIYNTTDDLSGAGYFNNWAAHLLVGDHIIQNTGTLTKQWTVITNTGGVVTVASVV